MSYLLQNSDMPSNVSMSDYVTLHRQGSYAQINERNEVNWKRDGKISQLTDSTLYICDGRSWQSPCRFLTITKSHDHLGFYPEHASNFQESEMCVINVQMMILA